MSSKRFPPTRRALASIPRVPTSKKRPVSPVGKSRSCSKYQKVQIVAFEIVAPLETATRTRLSVSVGLKFRAVTNQRPERRSKRTRERVGRLAVGDGGEEDVGIGVEDAVPGAGRLVERPQAPVDAHEELRRPDGARRVGRKRARIRQVRPEDADAEALRGGRGRRRDASGGEAGRTGVRAGRGSAAADGEAWRRGLRTLDAVGRSLARHDRGRGFAIRRARAGEGGRCGQQRRGPEPGAPGLLGHEVSVCWARD